MGFGTGSWAKVWETKPAEKYTDVRISTSHKDQTGKYVQDFGNWVRFVGEAHRKAKDIGEGARIKIGSCSVENRYDKEKERQYTSFLVFGFELANDDNLTTAAPRATKAEAAAKMQASFASIEDTPDDEEDPF